jgi:two-component system response regulator AtoC
MEDHGQRVLVIDDDAPVRALLVRYLSNLGYQCLQAGTGQEAIELLAAQKFLAVFSDLQMPNLNGLQLLGRIRESNTELVVIMITGVNDATAAVEAMKLGADDYIVKPFSLLEVSSSLNRALKKRGYTPRTGK